MSEQNSPIEKIQEHFRSKLSGGLKRLAPPEGEQFSVPEWKLDIYYGPETIESQDKYLDLLLKRKTEGYVELLIARARTADGKPLFRPADRLAFMREADPDLVTRVGTRIFNDLEVSVDDARKS